MTRPKVEEPPPPHPKKKGVKVQPKIAKDKPKSLEEASFQFKERAIGSVARFFNIPEQRVADIVLSLLSPLLEVELLVKSGHHRHLTSA